MHEEAGQAADAAGPHPRATDRPGDRSPFALGLLLRRAHARAVDSLVHAVRPLGLELRHFAVLIELVQSGPITQGDLRAAISMDKAMIVRVLDDLEDAGLATRKPLPTDRRVRIVEITDRGVEVFDQAHVLGRDIAPSLIEHMTSDQYDQLMDLLSTFTYPGPDPGSTGERRFE